ncbi:MAG: vWA domain-containing protein [Bacillota bacterium]
MSDEVVLRKYNVLFDDFEDADISDWQAFGSGALEFYSDGNCQALKKTAFCDPNGGYKLLSSPVTDFEVVLFWNRTLYNADCPCNRISIEDANWNGYGVCWVTTSGDFLIERRTGSYPVSITGSVSGNAPCVIGDWYTVRFIKQGDEFTAELYQGRTLDFFSPLAVASARDSAYSGDFDRLCIRGGYDYLLDNINVATLVYRPVLQGVLNKWEGYEAWEIPVGQPVGSVGVWVYDAGIDALVCRGDQAGFSGMVNRSFINWDDYGLEVLARFDTGSVGLTFRWQSSDNFYYVLLHEQGFDFGRVVGGQLSVIDQPLSPFVPVVGQYYRIKAFLTENRIRVWVDGVLQYDLEDDGLSHGAFGPFCLMPGDVYFTDFKAYLLPIKAFKSGIGDMDDCCVKPPREHEEAVSFSYGVRTVKIVDYAVNVFPLINFGYNVWAEGTKEEVLGPYPFSFDLKAYPAQVATASLVADGDYPATFDYALEAVADVLSDEVPYSFNIRVNYTDNEGGTGGGKADIIWLIDGSGSMGDDQTNLANNAASFTGILDQKGIDYRLGVVGFGDTSQQVKQYDSLGNEWTISSSEFSNMVTSVGTGLSGTECGLTAIRYALSNYTFRQDANIYLVLVTDEGASDAGTLAETLSALDQKNAVVFGIISPGDAAGYINGGVIDGTGGVYQDIATSDWSATLSQIAGSLATRVDGYTLVFAADNPAPTSGWSLASSQTVRQLIEASLGEPDTNLPTDLFTNTTRYEINYCQALSDKPNVVVDFSASASNIEGGSAPNTPPDVLDAYVAGQATEPDIRQEQVSRTFRCSDLPLSANSDLTRVAITETTAAETFWSDLIRPDYDDTFWGPAYDRGVYQAGTPVGWPDPLAHYIWLHGGSAVAGEEVYFRKKFSLTEATDVTIYATADDTFELYVDGELKLTGSGWENVYSVPLSLAAGEHQLAAKVKNISDLTLAWFILTVQRNTDGVFLCCTDTSWKAVRPVADYVVSTTYPGAYVTTAPDGTTPIYAWATAEATHYHGEWTLNFVAYAYEGQKVAARAADYLPVNAAGRLYPGTEAAYVLNKLSGDAAVYWLDSGVAGPGDLTDFIVVAADLVYYGGVFNGQLDGGQVVEFPFPVFKDESGNPMPEYADVHYALTDLSKNKVWFYFYSNPTLTTRDGREFIVTPVSQNKVVATAPAEYATSPWTSDIYHGYASVNGLEPMVGEGGGFAPATVPMPEIEIPPNVTVSRYVVGDISNSFVHGYFASTLRNETTNPQDKIIFEGWYTEPIKASIPVPSEEVVTFATIFPGELYTSPPFVIGEGETLVVRSLTPGVEVWVDGDTVKARVSGSLFWGKWSPYIHSGHYALGEKQHYLYAQRFVKTGVPDQSLRIYLSPIPRQGAPVVVVDSRGNELRPVAFRDDAGKLTLYNTESFSGLTTNIVYLMYRDIEDVSVILNDVPLDGCVVEGKKLVLPAPLKEADELLVRYRLRGSYYIEPLEGVIDTAVLQLSPPWYDGQYDSVTVDYEGSAFDPYCFADGVELNPVHNHNHTGFLYISNAPQRVLKLSVNVTPRCIRLGSQQPVAVTARLVDDLGNGVPGELIRFTYTVAVERHFADVYTNEAGEAYCEFVPEVSGTLTARWRDETAVFEVKDFDPGFLPEAHLCVDVKPEVVSYGQEALLTVRLYDGSWLSLSGADVTLKYTDDAGVEVRNTLTTDSSGKATYVYRGGALKRTVRFVLEYEDITAWATVLQRGTA